MTPVQQAKVDRIKALQIDATMFQAKSQTADAQAREDIFQAVKDAGGTPGVDSLCLECATTIKQGEAHKCPPKGSEK